MINFKTKGINKMLLIAKVSAGENIIPIEENGVASTIEVTEMTITPKRDVFPFKGITLGRKVNGDFNTITNEGRYKIETE